MGTPLIILSIIFLYFLVWVAVSYISSKGADNATFFSGNRKMAWPLVAIAMMGAPITGVTFISVPGMVVTKGYSYLQMCLGFIVGYVVIAFVLIPLYYRLRIVSIYGFLERRFGKTSSQTGAWLFFVSKLIGISVRFLVVCAMLQFLVFDPLGIPFAANVAVSLLLVWVTTYKGGVRSVIWGDVLKSLCLLSAIGLSLYFLLEAMGTNLPDIFSRITAHPSSRIFYLDDPADPRYFWKQFVAGVFIVIAMTGLDQDMMQRALACKDAKASRKNMISASLMQVAVISCLLLLGSVMAMYMESLGETIPEKTDNIFATVAFHEGIPLVLGCLFIVGIVSATYSSVASALTSMTTAVTMDILPSPSVGSERPLNRRRIVVHASLAILMAILVMMFYYLNRDDAISTVYTLISYTDGPILALFLFGLLSRRQVNLRALPVVCMLAPVLSFAIQWGAERYFMYHISYELLLINSGFTYLGLLLFSYRPALALDMEP